MATRSNRARGEFSSEHVGVVTKPSMFLIVGDGMTRAAHGRGVEDQRLTDEVRERFERVDRRLDEAFVEITQQFVEQRTYVEFGYERLDKAVQTLHAGIARLERKLDRILALSVESARRAPRS